MNKLQLYINKSGVEYKNIFNLNPDEDVRRCILDVRRALQIPDYDVLEKNTFFFVRYLDSGMLVGVICTSIGQKANHVAAWIFVPYDLRVEAEALMEVVNLVARKISGPSISPEDMAELRAAFSAEYQTNPDAAGIVGNRGEEYAFRYYGGDTDRELIDLLGVYLYQSAYLPYAGVLLVDASLGIECHGTDLSDLPFEQMVEMLPPEVHPDGFKPYLFGQLFAEPLLVPLREQVEIVWRRPGFQDMTQQIAVTEAGMQPECASTGESRKRITPKCFSVTSLSSHRPLTDECEITVNGINIAEGHSFTQSELANAELTVSCEGYETYSARTNLAQSAQTIIRLRERGKIYNFEISAKSSDIAGMIHFRIHTSGELTESPIDGYELADDIQEGASRSNHLVYDGGDQRKALIRNVIWGVAGAVVGALLMLLCTCRGSEGGNTDQADSTRVEMPAPAAQEQPSTSKTETDKPKETQAQAQASAPAVNSARSLQAAVEYLDANKSWNKDSLDLFPDLRGLYEDMNTFNHQRLTDVWGPKLKESRHFALVADHAKKGMKKKPRTKGNRTTYNPADDKTISVQSYLNTIDP